jgi:hypothetical protein
MRHVLSEPRSGSVVRLRPGDWLEVQLSHALPGFDWQVVDQPGCLFPIFGPASADRPSVLPTGPRFRSLGFLAFAGGQSSAHRLRLELVHPHRHESAEVRELDVVVA